jgi:hypothetical protein
MATNKPKKAKKTTAPAQAGSGEAVAPAQSTQATAPAQAGAVAQSTPNILTSVVGKIGWENGNERISVILIDKKLRAVLGIEPNEPVVVSKGDKTKIAFVHIQFWELCGTGKATLNGNLAQALTADIGSEITLRKPTDGERAEFQRVESERMRAFLSSVMGALAQGQAGQGE